MNAHIISDYTFLITTKWMKKKADTTIEKWRRILRETKDQKILFIWNCLPFQIRSRLPYSLLLFDVRDLVIFSFYVLLQRIRHDCLISPDTINIENRSCLKIHRITSHCFGNCFDRAISLFSCSFLNLIFLEFLINYEQSDPWLCSGIFVSMITDWFQMLPARFSKSCATTLHLEC